MTVRNPLDIAASLERRNGFSQAKSLLLWLVHVLPAERTTRHDHRLFISYDGLLDDWREVVRRVESASGLQLTDAETATAEIDSFIDRGLRHHARPAEDVMENDQLARAVRQTYRWLTAAAASGTAPETREMDDIAVSLRDAQRLYEPVLADTAAGWESVREIQEEVRDHVAYLDRVFREHLEVSEDRFTEIHASLLQFQEALDWLRDTGAASTARLDQEIARVSESLCAEIAKLDKPSRER